MDNNEFTQLQKMFRETVEQTIKEHSADGNVSERVAQLIDSELAVDALAYIQRQLNNSSFLGYINQGQHNMLLQSSIQGLFVLVYVKHYETDEDLVDKDPIFESCKNLLMLLFTRPLLGRDRQMALEEIKSKQANNIIMQRG